MCLFCTQPHTPTSTSPHHAAPRRAVRIAKFVPRKQWVVCGADDMFVRVYNYNTMDKVKQFEAHTDYIRCAACAGRGGWGWLGPEGVRRVWERGWLGLRGERRWLLEM